MSKRVKRDRGFRGIELREQTAAKSTRRTPRVNSARHKLPAAVRPQKRVLSSFKEVTPRGSHRQLYIIYGSINISRCGGKPETTRHDHMFVVALNPNAVHDQDIALQGDRKYTLY